MKNHEKVKMLMGYILIGFSIVGIFVALSYQFNLNIVKNDYRVFARGADGGSSNLPIFYGFSAIAGAILLVCSNKKN